MAITKYTIQKWVFAFLLAMPVFYLYLLHFFYRDAAHLPSGFIQWEHILYMCSAKEYVTGNAHLLYQYPILNNFNDGNIFFQPQFLVLGYCWKWFDIEPAILLMVFNFIFAILTLKIVIEIFAILLPQYKYQKLITVLFCWGGGILSLAGLGLHFFYFKGGLDNIAKNIFFLDPGNGGWCLNFGRSLMYPLEAYYHFLFVCCIWLVLTKRFLATFLVLLLLILSHPYSSIEIICILLAWITAEVFYFKNVDFKKSHFYFILSAFLLFFIYHSGVLGRFETYRQINKLIALDWGYKAWHFVPAYAIVWFLSFLCVKNIPSLKKHFADSRYRLFFWWGTVAFFLSVHGFALKPVQPIHFTRGYVYAGFFLFCLPALQHIIEKYAAQKIKGKLILYALVFIFLFDNSSWFAFAAEKPNDSGYYFSKEEKEVINFFKQKKDTALVIGSEKNYPLNIGVQLYGNNKAWLPHPFLTFDIDEKRKAVAIFLQDDKKDSAWTKQATYIYVDKNDSINYPLQHLPPPVFENSTYNVYKIN